MVCHVRAQIFATAAGLANTHKSRVTVLLVDEAKPGGDQATRIETASWCAPITHPETSKESMKSHSTAAHNSQLPLELQLLWRIQSACCMNCGCGLTAHPNQVSCLACPYMQCSTALGASRGLILCGVCFPGGSMLKQSGAPSVDAVHLA
jgi:hypothetical protein